MPAFSVATNGDLACFARGINVGVAAGAIKRDLNEGSISSRRRGRSVNRPRGPTTCVDTLSRKRECRSPRKRYWKILPTRN